MSVVDLNNTFKYDKIVINLNNHNCLQVNTAESCFYVNLVEPIKNIIYIKILKANIISTNAIKTENALLYKRNDPIHVSINDYDRSVSYLKSVQVSTSNYLLNGVPTVLTTSKDVFDTVKYFDIIPYADTTFSDLSNSQTSFDWTDSTVYILNPPEPNLRRLNIEFRDKTFKPFDTAILTDFNVSLCIYYIKNRV
jgi:hypothetical protein